mgnify:CR=1 FL=1
MDSGSLIMDMKGIGPKTNALFGKLGLRTVGDLLEYYPREYDRFQEPVSAAQVRVMDFAAVKGMIVTNPSVKKVKTLQIVSMQIRDDNGDQMKVTWFNMPFLCKTMHPGMHYVFRGRIKGYGADRQMEQPQYFTLAQYESLVGSMQPIYGLTKGLTSKMISKAVRQALEQGVRLRDPLDVSVREAYGLMEKQEAVAGIHFPGKQEMFLEARKRLVFEEFYCFLLGVRQMKAQMASQENHFVITPKREVEELIQRLPYALTKAQRRTLQEIQADMTGPGVMNRLVQGDVGSGKTIVAFLALYQAALCGYQGVMMAPTEVLARQHYQSFCRLVEEQGLMLTIELLTGSMTASQKRKVYEKTASHQVDIVIGTHALIQENVHYQDLGLVITDEQHRFGVRQREALKNKGQLPHVLVMSATPIPRTLAIILYGDLDISVMDELPASRLPIKNCVVDINYRPNAYAFIQKQVEAGRQAYVICPMVEESEAMDAEDVVTYSRKLTGELPPSIRVAYLHGKLSNQEKDRIMEAFAANEIQVLVSTTVIEVGIDVPNATVIMIENAERFGLAQLHQLRGRVGRGAHQSYCILVNTSSSRESQKRLEILNHSNDGFFIASEDLKLRGPGEFFGVRQSGELAFKLGDVYTDAEILREASEAAKKTEAVDWAIPVSM